MFPGSDNRYKLLEILSYIWVCRKSKMVAINRKWIGYYISPLVYMIGYSNEITTATPMIPGSNGRYRLLEILSYIDLYMS